MSLNNNTTSLQAILTTVNALPDKVDTSGTATAADIYTGKTATVNDAKLTGTNPYNAATVDPAVTSALAAIAEKGVDTTGAGLGDIAALVESIEAGGGRDVVFGSFTIAETPTEPIVIEHNLGKIPKLIALFVDSSGLGTKLNTQNALQMYIAGEYIYKMHAWSVTQSSSKNTAKNDIFNYNYTEDGTYYAVTSATANTVNFNHATNFKMITGVTYNYVIAVDKESGESGGGYPV